MSATWILAAALGAISLVIFLLNIRHGIGVLPDSTRYMGISEVPYDAPVYAWLFAASGPLGLDLTTTATAVAVVVLGLNVVLLATLLFRLTERVAYVAAGSALVLISPQFVTLHALAMSEPLFVTLLLLTIHLSLTYLQSENRFWLVLSGLSLGAATLTRFTAPPLGAALVLAYMLNGHFPVMRRITDSALLFVTSGAMFFGWVAASKLSGEQSIGRDLALLGTMGAKEWYTSLTAMSAWFLPDNVPDAVRNLVLAGVLGSCAYFAGAQGFQTLRQSSVRKPEADLILVVLGFFFIFYVAFVFLASAIEANLHLNGRYGFPAYVALVVLASGLAVRYRSSSAKSRAFAIAATTFAALVLAAHGARTAVRTHEAYRDGVGYNSLEWKMSPTIASTRKLPANSVVYSNGSDAVAYITGRPTRFVPFERRLRTNLPDPSNPLSDQLAAMRKRAETQAVFVAYFDMVTWRPYLVEEQKLKAALGMELIESLPDGRIYKVAADANASPAPQAAVPEVIQ